MIKHKLCGIETVCSLSGQTRERTYELVDQGEYIWCWNISRTPNSRELRFWSPEINRKFLQQIAPSMISAENWLKRFTIDQIIAQIIPTRTALRGQFDGLRKWEVCILLRIHRFHLDLLTDELPQHRVKGDARIYIRRPDLESFFKDRWTGCLRTATKRELAHK